MGGGRIESKRKERGTTRGREEDEKEKTPSSVPPHTHTLSNLSNPISLDLDL